MATCTTSSSLAARVFAHCLTPRRRFDEQPHRSSLNFPSPSPSNSRRNPRIICMAEPYLLAKLDSAEKTWSELSEKLADPEVVSNHTEYQRLAQSVSELNEIVSTYRKFKECGRQLEESKVLAKESENDADMAEMIDYEIGSLSNQLRELEEKLKQMLLPSDPNDDRNIMLEVRAGAGGDEAGIWAGDLVGSDV